jgi:uncharacterized protein with PhoU and TrkA domain
MNPADPDSSGGGSDRVNIAPGSLLADQSLRGAGLPLSVIITTIQRNRDLVVPTGDTVLHPGDELVLIGSSGDIADVRELAMAHAANPASADQNGTREPTHHPTPFTDQ